MSKSPDAFRTIREVADWLGVAAHVLRFWESKFSQIRPVKRAGGRRYYRPGDMELVGGIKVLLHDRGMTVRGVQRMLREEGVAAVSALSPPLDAVDVPDELVEGIAEEAAWRADAVADSDATVEDAPATIPDPVGESVVAEQADEPALPGFDGPQPGEIGPDVTAPEAAARDQAANDEDVDTPAPESDANTALGLDRLAAFVAKAKTIPGDSRPSLRPAIAALRRLKERMERPVEPPVDPASG